MSETFKKILDVFVKVLTFVFLLEPVWMLLLFFFTFSRFHNYRMLSMRKRFYNS